MSAARSFKKHFAHKSLLRVYTDKIKESGAIGLDRTRPAKLDAKLTDELKLIIQKVQQGKYRFTAYKGANRENGKNRTLRFSGQP